MKLALATFSTALVLATGASAMVGPYERAVDNAPGDSSLFTTGAQDVKDNSVSTSPQAEWNNGEDKGITVFSTSSEGERQHFGVSGR